MTVADPDLYAFVIQLYPTETHPASRPLGQGVQALFLDLVRQIDPALAAALHADAPGKPYTVAILPTPARNGQVWLRISLLRTDLFRTFVQALLRQTGRQATLQLGKTAYSLGDIIGTPPPNGHPWAGYHSFTGLVQAATATATIELEFATATAIGQGTRPDGKPRLAILPDPELIFPSIAKRWNELAPPECRLDLEAVRVAANETLLSRYHAESVEINLGRGPQKGFIGRCIYELPPDPAQARLISLLASAVFFTGVGIKTARGMGLCRQRSEVGR